MRRRARIALLLAALVASCTPRPADEPASVDSARPGAWGPEERERAVAELERQRARWASGRPAAYRYALRGVCFCVPDPRGARTVTERDGRVVSVSDSVGATPASDSLGLVKPAAGLDSLFTTIASAMRDQRIDAVRVRYDERLGFPVEIIFDHIAQATDDEYYVYVQDFTPLP